MKNTCDEEFMTLSSWSLILSEYPTSGSTLPSLQPSQWATALGSQQQVQQSITPEPQPALNGSNNNHDTHCSFLSLN